jgi:hypothetical protein
MPIHFAPALLAATGFLGLRKLTSEPGDGDSSVPDTIPPDDDTDMQHDPTEDLGEYAGWTFPLPAWGGYRPTRSQEYRPADHHGVDVMYPRQAGGNDSVYASGTPNGSRNFFMPDNVPVYCPKDGTIWSTGISKHGPWCVIDCGKPIALYMVHFDQLLISGQSRGTPVNAGQMIGTVGFSPADPERLKHLHIEVWRGGAAESHVDPWPYLKGAARL